MKSSYFNPEVHSFTFSNFEHVVCGVSWGFQCGGMCCNVLSKFYNGELIDCESARGSFSDDIWNDQVGIISSDIYKSCGWDRSTAAIQKISENIDIGKPTLVYLDKEDWNLVDDHFVVAFAIDDISDSIKRVYLYDPNYVYKRHFCGNPPQEYCIDPSDPNSTLANFKSYLEINSLDKTVVLKNGTSSAPILGFKWYGQDQTGIPVSYYTDEKAVQHSCNISLISRNQPELINNIPLISHTIKISKEGNVPADLRLWYEFNQDLYESGGDLLFPVGLNNVFSSARKHIGLQAGNGYIDKTYKVYQNFAPSNPITIVLKSNFVEKSLILTFTKPAIKTFTAFLEGSTPHPVGYEADSVNNQIIEIQGLSSDNVIEVEKVPDNYRGEVPVNTVFINYTGTNWESAINSGAYTLFEPVLYLGYINRNVYTELTHNGLYTGARVKMTFNGSTPVEKDFINNAVTFTFPKGDKKLYDSNASKTISFEIKGGGISANFSESFSAILQYRCLIVHEPLVRRFNIELMDVFGRYFEELLIRIPHSIRILELEQRFNREFEKHPGMDREKYKKIFCEQLMKNFVIESKTFWNRKRIYNDFITSFHAYDDYRKERIRIILKKSKNSKERKQKLEILEAQMRPLIGKTLIAKEAFGRCLKKVLKREWK